MNNLFFYKDLDPDVLYNNYPEGSLTFFYVPNSGNLYAAPYPTNHRNMLIEDDDVFEDVYGDFEFTSEQRTKWASRGIVLQKTNCIVGRIAAVGEDIVLSLWSNPPKKDLVNFLTKLFKKYPQLEKKKENIVIVTVNGGEPYSLGGKPVKDTIKPVDTLVSKTIKKFKINGIDYSLQELQALRASLHTQTNKSALSILCHPDIEKYPELNGYKPSGCGNITNVRQSHPAKWRDAAQKANVPYVYSYGESFRLFLRKKENES